MFDIERKRIKLFAKVWNRFQHRRHLEGDMAAYSKFYEDLVTKYYVENVKSGRKGFYHYTRLDLVLAPVLLVVWLANWFGGHPVWALVSFVALSKELLLRMMFLKRQKRKPLRKLRQRSRVTKESARRSVLRSKATGNVGNPRMVNLIPASL